MSTDVRSVAAFDFDGTLSRRDTLVPFLAKVGDAGVSPRSAHGSAWRAHAVTSTCATATA